MRHYNKVLSEQLPELRSQAAGVEMGFRMEFGLEPGRGLNPRRLGDVLEQTSRQWRVEVAEQQRDMRMLDDAAATKRWLRRQRRLLDEAQFDYQLF